MSGVVEKVKDLVHGHSDVVDMAGFKVHSIGYGLMGLTWKKNPPPQEQSFAAMKAALENGANLWNGGEIYGPPDANSLQLLRAYFEKYPEDAEKVVISIKGGAIPGSVGMDGSPENTRRSIDECLKVLDGKKKLDIWESARVDPKTPIEITMREAAKYVASGKLGGISLSECSADTIRRAAAVTKIAAVEVEFSLWSTEILTNGVAQACAELDIPIVAYSPLGRGFLTGQIKKLEDIPENDMRRNFERFFPENFDTNLKLVHELERIAEKKGCKPGQVGIAWVKAQSGAKGKGGLEKMPVIIPIPGATTEERIEENMVDVSLSESEEKEIDELIASVTIKGGRYNDHLNPFNFGDSPALQE